MSSKKKILNVSSKLKFKKPSKKLTNIIISRFTCTGTVTRFGSYALQALRSGLMSKGEIESARITLNKPLKAFSKSRVWSLVQPDRIVTKRSAETRMGKGKGAPLKQVALIHKGQLLFEFIGPEDILASRIFNKAYKKISIPTRLISC